MLSPSPPRRIFFFDDRDVERLESVYLRPCSVRKTGVLFDAKPGVDLDWVSVFAGTVTTLPDGRYRMYYYTHSAADRTMRIGIAESADGFHWERANLDSDGPFIRIEGLYEGANITQPSVVRTRDGRWLMYCWLHGQSRGCVRYIVSESEDGLHWRLTNLHRPALFHPADLELGGIAWKTGKTEPLAEARFAERRQWQFLAAKRLRSNDATYVYYNPFLDLYEMFSVWLLPNPPESGRVTPHDNVPDALRVIHRRTSEDGLEWSDPELIITPDAGDPLDQQFYYLSVHNEDATWRIGFLGHYRCWEQTMDIELCFSRDGRHWLRPLRGGFVPRDPIPERGCMSAYAAGALLPVEGDRWLLLYTAGNEMHNHRLPDGVSEPWRGVCGAVWPRGRYAGAAAVPNTIGRILLRPTILSAPAVTVDADVRGVLRAELRDPLGGRIPGFELYRSVPVRGDSRNHLLRWGESGRTSSAYRYDAVRIYLEIEDGIVYSVSV